MISLYESLLADIDDTLKNGDSISSEVLANEPNSLIRHIFPVKSNFLNHIQLRKIMVKKY